MKSTNIIYWTTTVIIAIMMTFSAYNYLTQEAMQAGFHHLGFPDYFRVEVAVAKLIGTIVLLSPVAARVKEWAYAGFGMTFISAVIAHTASGDPVINRIMPIIFLIVLVVSYVTYHRRHTASQNAISPWQAIS